MNTDLAWREATGGSRETFIVHMWDKIYKEILFFCIFVKIREICGRVGGVL